MKEVIELSQLRYEKNHGFRTTKIEQLNLELWSLLNSCRVNYFPISVECFYIYDLWCSPFVNNIQESQNKRSHPRKQNGNPLIFNRLIRPIGLNGNSATDLWITCTPSTWNYYKQKHVSLSVSSLCMVHWIFIVPTYFVWQSI